MITEEEYQELKSKQYRFENVSCSCHTGNPPCSRCVDGISKEEEEMIEEYERSKK